MNATQFVERHLIRELCRRLYKMGCQLTEIHADGCEPFKLRKDTTTDATGAARRIMNYKTTWDAQFIFAFFYAPKREGGGRDFEMYVRLTPGNGEDLISDWTYSVQDPSPQRCALATQFGQEVEKVRLV